MRRKGARKFTAITRSKVALSTSSAQLPPWLIPALLTRMSTFSSRSTASIARRSVAAMPSRSATSPCAGLPGRDSASAARATSSPDRAATATVQPCSTKASAMACPMPRVPPVTRAVLPLRSNSVVRRTLLKSLAWLGRGGLDVRAPRAQSSLTASKACRGYGRLHSWCVGRGPGPTALRTATHTRARPPAYRHSAHRCRSRPGRCRRPAGRCHGRRRAGRCHFRRRGCRSRPPHG